MFTSSSKVIGPPVRSLTISTAFNVIPIGGWVIIKAVTAQLQAALETLFSDGLRYATAISAADSATSRGPPKYSSSLLKNSQKV
jgi:hypothetical protein